MVCANFPNHIYPAPNKHTCSHCFRLVHRFIRQLYTSSHTPFSISRPSVVCFCVCDIKSSTLCISLSEAAASFRVHPRQLKVIRWRNNRTVTTTTHKNHHRRRAVECVLISRRLCRRPTLVQNSSCVDRTILCGSPLKTPSKKQPLSVSARNTGVVFKTVLLLFAIYTIT